MCKVLYSGMLPVELVFSIRNNDIKEAHLNASKCLVFSKLTSLIDVPHKDIHWWRYWEIILESNQFESQRLSQLQQPFFLGIKNVRVEDKNPQNGIEN